MATHLAQYRGGPLDVVVHVGSAEDVELRFALDDAIDFAARMLEAVSAGLGGETTGMLPEPLQMLERSTAEILAAHMRPVATGAQA